MPTLKDLRQQDRLITNLRKNCLTDADLEKLMQINLGPITMHDEDRLKLFNQYCDYIERTIESYLQGRKM